MLNRTPKQTGGKLPGKNTFSMAQRPRLPARSYERQIPKIARKEAFLKIIVFFEKERGKMNAEAKAHSEKYLEMLRAMRDDPELRLAFSEQYLKYLANGIGKPTVNKSKGPIKKGFLAIQLALQHIERIPLLEAIKKRMDHPEQFVWVKHLAEHR